MAALVANRQFRLTAPIENAIIRSELKHSGGVLKEVRFNKRATWNHAALDQLFEMASEFEDDPLIALMFTGRNLIVGGAGIFRSPSDVQDRYCRYRLRLWRRVLEKYPSAYWFSSRFYDDAWDIWGANGTYAEPYLFHCAEELRCVGTIPGHTNHRDNPDCHIAEPDE